MRAFLQKRWVRLAGYVLFGMASLVFFFYFTFPAQAVGQRVATEIQKATGGSVNVMFTDVSLYRFSGIAARHVKIRSNSDSGPPLELEVDGLRLRLLPLLWFSLSVNAGVDLGDGTLEAQLSKSDDGFDIALEADEVDFAAPAIIAKLTGLPIQGTLDGSVRAKIGFGGDKRAKGPEPGKRGLIPDQADGEASLTISKASFGPGTVAGFTIPEGLDFGQLDLALDMKKGRLRVAAFKQKGGQVAVDLSGSSSLRAAVFASTLDACLKFKVTDEAYLTKNPKVSTALQLAAVQLKKDPEGYLHLKLGGTFASVRRQAGLCRSGTKP
ncbi:MAG: type II secretion system protein GspN [Deltaproteobacteria bacterium]|nr:type II secretion system protein GspN [Deltaproteobacteria bacterium]